MMKAYYHEPPSASVILRFRPCVSLNERICVRPFLPILMALVCVAASQQSSLKFTVPAGWVEEERTSSMRVAQYRLPKAAGDTEDASLVLYYFGQGQGGINCREHRTLGWSD